MEKVIPFFQYEFLVLISKSETLNEEEKKVQTNGARPSNIRIVKEELVDFRRGKDNSQEEARGMKYVLKHSLKPLEYIPQEVSSQEYGFAAIEITKKITN